MPTWIVHGFRWPRAAIRIHVIVQNLDDAAPEWLMAPATTACMKANFTKQWPEQMEQLPGLQFLEQYDPDDLKTKDQPYAYVCDLVHEVKLGVELDELRGKGVPEEQWAAIAELRDMVAPGEKLGWFVVVNGDVERWAPPLNEEGDYTEAGANRSSNIPNSQRSSIGNPDSQRSSVGKISDVTEPSQEKSSTFKKWIGGRLKRSKSGRDLGSSDIGTAQYVPPLPPVSPKAALEPSVSTKAKPQRMSMR